MSDPSDLYKIGTVAKLTGIAVERLRAWERRYGLTPASREGKTRFFSGAQVERLSVIRRLIDQGHPVSTLINLDSDTLNERLQEIQHSQSAAKQRLQENPRVALAGTQLLMLEQMLQNPPQLQISSRWVNLPVALEDMRQSATAAAENALAPAPDVLVTLLGSVTPETLAQLDELPNATKPLIIYHFATEAGLSDGEQRDWDMLRWPVSWDDIEEAVARRVTIPTSAAPLAARRFSDEQLLSIASTGSGSLSGWGCACPADLVNLISTLNAFTEHSAACGPSEQAARSPREAAPPMRAAATRHTQIAQRTSQARLELELVLEEWVLEEGVLPVPN